LRTCPDVCILATSREALGVSGEVEYRVPPFALALAGPAIDAKELMRNESVELFVTRVRAIDPDFDPTLENISTAAHICRNLGGLPLAIELASARARSMSLADIARELDDPLALLVRGPRAAPFRQQSLRATIDWSYQLLTQPERDLLRRVAVFHGGFTRQAAISVCADEQLPAASISELLERLKAQSLLTVKKTHDQTRFIPLEAIRLYGLERLEQAGELFTVRARHRDWCLDLVSDAVPESFDVHQLAVMDREQENLLAALRWTIGQAQVTHSARLAERLAPGTICAA
jgi:non-specific serine/threonine protein kinase